MHRWILLLLASAGCSSEPIPPPPASCAPVTTAACNGSESLCDRRFDEISFATTHNAMSSEEDGWWIPNQSHGIGQQLEDGVRGLMLDTHEWMGEPHLCHADCDLGNLPLVDGLATIREFLDCHPGEVVSLVFESYVDGETTAKAFETSGLDALAHPHIAGDPWPTLREMIATNRRLVVFTDEGGGARDWYLDQWAHAWQNPYAAETAADFSCDVHRGSGDSPIFIMNHFLTSPVAMPELAAEVNHNPLFLERAEQCRTEVGRIPNFVTVDFYDIGDVFAVVDALNAAP